MHARIILCCAILTGICLFRSVLQGSTAAEAGNVDGEGYGCVLRKAKMCYGARCERIARKIRSSD